MPTNIKFEGKDLEEIFEKSRGPEDYLNGRTYPINPSYFTPNPKPSTNIITPLTNFFEPINSTYDSGVDLQSKLNFPIAVRSAASKGRRPRILRADWYFPIDGTLTKRFYTVKRRETSIEIYYSTKPNFEFVPYSSIPITAFSGNYIPHVLLFQMCGGGGGGGGGAVIEADGGNTGATGGGGGGIAYGWIEIFDTPGSNPTSQDYVFEIFKGGSGASWGTFRSSGRPGEPTRLLKNGSVLITAEAGVYGRGAGVINNAACPNLLAWQSGGYPKVSVSFNQEIEKESISWYSPAGGSGDSSGWRGWSADGGGASIGYGGRGYEKSHNGGSGYRGGGGGGGTGFFTAILYTSTAKSGGNGGNGFLAFYY